MGSLSAGGAEGAGGWVIRGTEGAEQMRARRVGFVASCLFSSLSEEEREATGQDTVFR